MAFLKIDKLMIGRGKRAGNEILHFLRSLLTKITSGLKNSAGHAFWIKKLKNDIEIDLKSTGIEI